MAAWEPDANSVSELLQLLQLSHGADNRTHKAIYERLSYYSANIPDFASYLVFILVGLPEAGVHVRAASGLLLKTNIMRMFDGMPDDVQRYVCNNVLGVLGDEAPLIRATVAVITSSIIQRGGLQAWPDLLELLAEAMESDDPNVVEGALNALNKLSEDVPRVLVSPEAGGALNHMIPKWISFFPCEIPKIRSHALACITHYIEFKVNALNVNIEDFVEGLYVLAMDDYMPVRRLVCESMVLLLSVRPDALLDEMDKIVEYMLACAASDDEQLALEACEFWSTFAESAIAKGMLRPILGPLMPVLLKNMVYSEFDKASLDNDETYNNAHEADRAEDIEPRFHTAARKREGMQNDGDGDDNYDSDDDEDGDFGDTDWNLRKSAAASLDILAGEFKEELLPHVIPVIESAMNSEHWDVRESAILALGAIAEGCSDGLSQDLPDLLGYLMSDPLHDPKPLIRKISCWALGRYAQWMVWRKDAAAYMEPLVAGLLTRMQDSNKQVQEAATSAFAVLEEEATDQLAPFLDEILTAFVDCLGRFQVRNRRILFDAIGTLAENVGPEFARDSYFQGLMEPLLDRWLRIDMDDVSLYPLMECLGSVAKGFGPIFTEAVPHIFPRACHLVNEVLEAYDGVDEDDWEFLMELPDKDVVVSALDLLSNVTDAVGASVETLVAETNILDLLGIAMSDPIVSVRQSAFALVGDFAKVCIGHMGDHLEAYLPIMIANLDPAYTAACNNAGWALGEITMQVGTQIGPYVEPMLVRLIDILNTQKNRNLLENTAIAIGRLGLQCPEIVAPRLPAFVQNWCLALRNIRDDEEKASAFRGMCAMIEIYPEGVIEKFILICDAIGSWQEPPDDLRNAFSELLNGFKSNLTPEGWAQYISHWPDPLRYVLSQQYGLT